jgi:hypothetical protein
MTTENTERTDSTVDRFLQRRTLLKTTGAGLGALSLASTSSVASAKTGCARGPFASSYEPGTINVGRIRAEQARGKDPGPMGSAAPGDTDSSSVEAPPGASVQETTASGDGSLEIETEYDGVNSLETRGGVPSDSQVAVGDGKLLHVVSYPRLKSWAFSHEGVSAHTSPAVEGPTSYYRPRFGRGLSGPPSTVRVDCPADLIAGGRPKLRGRPTTGPAYSWPVQATTFASPALPQKTFA